MSDAKQHISIWFFIGALLLVYGVLIFGAELHAISNPAEHQVVLQELRAGLWFGGLLTVMGLLYVVKFRPGKR